jgi:hypothetical protein
MLGEDAAAIVNPAPIDPDFQQAPTLLRSFLLNRRPPAKNPVGFITHITVAGAAAAVSARTTRSRPAAAPAVALC